MPDHLFPPGERLRRSAVSRAELLYFQAGHGPEALRRSAALFGYLAPEEEKHEFMETTVVATATTVAPTTSLVDQPPVSLSGPRYLRLRRRETVPDEERRTEAPSRLAATPPLSPYSGHQDSVAPDPPPLTSWRRLWPLLRMVLGVRNQGQAIDLPRLVEGLSRGRTFRRLPRISRSYWAPLAQLVVDQGLSLYPFWQDFEDLVTGLQRLRGRSGLEVIGFPEGPDRETISWARGRLRRESPYRLPEPGTPILILSDLGYLDGRPDPWLAFGRRLQAAGFRPVALMPCPPRYWDHELGELFFPVVWDRNRRLPRRLDAGRPRPETAGPDPGVEQLLRLIAWAVRVEPSLLRALRVLLGADRADVGSEAAVWRHPDVQNNGLTLVLRPERQKPVREAAALEAQQGGTETRTIYAEAHRLLAAFHGGLHPAILAEEEMLRAQSLGVTPSPAALDFMWRIAATLDRPQGYPHLSRLQAWVLRMAERQHPDLWRWEAGEPMAIALAKVMMEQVEDQADIPFPPGFDSNRVLWALEAAKDQHYELRQEVTRRGERRLVLKSPGASHTDGLFGRGDVLIAPLSLSTTRVEWQHLDEAGNAGLVQGVDIRHERAIPVPPSGRLLVRSDRERLEIDALERPVWAVRIEQGRGPQGEDRFFLSPRDRPDQTLEWLLPADYPVLDRDNRIVGRFGISEGRFVGLETYQELRKQGFRQPGWAQRIGQDEYGLFADLVFQGITQRFRWIMPGRFWMGSPEEEPERRENEGPRHEVMLSQGFWLADTACTQALWEALMGENHSYFKGLERPVERVSWDDVQEFLDRLNHLVPGLEARLPFEAEWEYACRAGTETPFWFGANITPDQVNYNGNYPYAGGGKGLYRKETVAVKALPCNGWGLYQMHGNVWEWCADWHDDYPPGPVTDPTGPALGADRGLRGGSWVFNAGYCRSAYRFRNEPDYRFVIIGFRLARGQTGKQARK